jgi:hypothetical protein
MLNLSAIYIKTSKSIVYIFNTIKILLEIVINY